MRVVASRTLRDFWAKHPAAEQALRAWLSEVRQAEWQRPGDVKAKYRSVSVLKNRRMVFNIKGNDYRMVVVIAYRVQVVYVKFIGTHAQYDAIDAETVEME